MIYKLIIGVLLLATILYYYFCFLEIFGAIKFTGRHTTIKIPQMFIPFYYLLKKDKPEDESGDEPGDNQKDYPIIAYPGIIPAWITMEYNVGVGTKAILVTVKRNDCKAARCGEIIITDTRTGDIHTVTVNQKGKAAKYTGQI